MRLLVGPVLLGLVQAKDFYSFKANTIMGTEMDLHDFRGTVSLVVNVASECGYTDSHYRQLPKLQSALQDYNFQVLAFPCNQFGSQEPGTSLEILNNIGRHYDLNYQLFEKVDILGPDAHPAFRWLIETSEDEPTWNFWKYLIDPEGQPIDVRAWGPEFQVDDIAEEIKSIVKKYGKRTNEPHREL